MTDQRSQKELRHGWGICEQIWEKCDSHTKARLIRIRTYRNRSIRIGALSNVPLDQCCNVLGIECALFFFFFVVVMIVKFKGREMSYYVIPYAPIGPRELKKKHDSEHRPYCPLVLLCSTRCVVK